MISIIIVVYSIAICVAIVGILIYRNWCKSQTSATVSNRPANTGLPIAGGLKNVKIVNKV